MSGWYNLQTLSNCVTLQLFIQGGGNVYVIIIYRTRFVIWPLNCIDLKESSYTSKIVKLPFQVKEGYYHVTLR